MFPVHKKREQRCFDVLLLKRGFLEVSGTWIGLSDWAHHKSIDSSLPELARSLARPTINISQLIKNSFQNVRSNVRQKKSVRSTLSTNVPRSNVADDVQYGPFLP